VITVAAGGDNLKVQERKAEETKCLTALWKTQHLKTTHYLVGKLEEVGEGRGN
jgi:hypothetical protein